MKSFMLKKCLIMILIVVILPLPAQVGASSIVNDSTFEGYIYDTLEQTVHSINGYVYSGSILGEDLATGGFNNPDAIFVREDDNIFISDTGNNRVIHLDHNRDLLQIYGTDDDDGNLNSPRGVYATMDGRVYVADTGNRRIVVFEQGVGYTGHFEQPESPLLGDGFVYTPSKLIVDRRGYMYVISDGSDKGLLQIDPNGEFRGFYGSNHVEFSLMRVIIRLVASREQRAQLALVRPPTFSNLYQDSEGYIYTTTLGIDYNQVKRLSAVGVDTLNLDGEQNIYGDIYMQTRNWERQNETFVAVTVDNNGLITALDQTTGRAFQYDQLGNLLFAFGGKGNRDGLFDNPVSIDQTSDGTMFIVDSNRGRVDYFRRTAFAEKVHVASQLYVEGRYAEAMEPWQEVIDINSNYDLAYRAIGKALEKEERYEEAIEYFRKARSRDEYSVAFLEFRKEYMREHFGWIVSLFFISFFGIRFGLKRVRRKAQEAKLAGKGGITQ